VLWLNACNRCKQGAVYLDVDDLKHCVHCGFVEYRPLTPDFVLETGVSRDQSDIRSHLPAASRASA